MEEQRARGGDTTGSLLSDIEAWPEVASWVERVREAGTQLRWHGALRRRIPEAAAESRVWGAAASAELDGARTDVAHVRDLLCGALPDEGNADGEGGGEGSAPGDDADSGRREGPRFGRRIDPVEATVRAAARVTAESEYVRPLLRRSPAQALARLHLAAGAQLVIDDAVGRPRRPGEACGEFADLGPPPEDPAEVSARLSGVYALLADASAPAFVAAAIVHAEIVHVRPFVRGNGLVARALERAYLVESGLEPTGVAVPEAGHLEVGATAYLGSLAGYGTGSRAGLELWLGHCGQAWCEAASLGGRIADAVRTGRFDPQR